jgi:hypothetical protein
MKWSIPVRVFPILSASREYEQDFNELLSISKKARLEAKVLLSVANSSTRYKIDSTGH